MFPGVFIQWTAVETPEAHFIHHVGYNWLLRVGRQRRANSTLLCRHARISTRSNVRIFRVYVTSPSVLETNRISSGADPRGLWK